VKREKQHEKPTTEEGKLTMMNQPLPTPNDRPHVTDLVMQDLSDRKALGIARYNTPLQPFNGRDSLQDAYEECLDQALYLRQWMQEKDELMAALDSLFSATTPDEGRKAVRRIEAVYLKLTKGENDAN
jgi:hypothetical protein